MFTRLKVTNFKPWKEAELSFGRITGLFGTNSSGKSSLTQLLLMLKQTMESTDRNVALDLNGAYVELGTMADVLFGHDEKLWLNFEVDMLLDEELVISDPSKARASVIARSRDLSIVADVRSRGQAPKGDFLSYQLADAKFILDHLQNDGSKYRLQATNADGFHFIRSTGRAWSLPGPMKTYQFPDQARLYYQNASFLADLENSFEEQFDQLFYLGPLREYPQRDYLWARSSPKGVGQRGERAIDAILAAQAAQRTVNLKPKARHKRFSEMVAYWLKEMGLIEAFSVEEIAKGTNHWQAKVRTQKKSNEVLLTDVGFGVSQVLPVITLLYYVPEGSTVILEQPEIHLHPLAQAGLADLIINVATHRNVQIILESHSEHLLLRLQRRIAEEKIKADDVKLYFCDCSKGCSEIKRLQLDIFGNIENWPDRFMGDVFTETAKAELARVRRMKTAAE